MNPSGRKKTENYIDEVFEEYKEELDKIKKKIETKTKLKKYWKSIKEIGWLYGSLAVFLLAVGISSRQWFIIVIALVLVPAFLALDVLLFDE